MHDNMAQDKADLGRIASLRRTGLLDSPPDVAFDQIVLLLQQMLNVPTALISLVDEQRQFFKSAVGLGEPWASARETPLSHSFCKHVVADSQPLIVTDANLNPRVKDNLAVRDLSVIAYAGAPLLSPDGVAVGALCAIDSKPRIWTDHELAILNATAAVVTSQIETFQRNQEQLKALRDAHVIEARFRTFMDRSPAVAYIKDDAGRMMYVNETMLRYYPDAKNWIGKLNEEIWPVDIARQLRANDLSAVAVETGMELEEYVESFNTVAQHWLTFKFPLHEADGRTLLAGMSINIDKHKREEAELRASELKVRAIYDSALQFIGLLESDGKVIDMNATSLAFIDQPLSAVVGKPLWKCPWWTHSSAVAEACKNAVQRAAGGEIVRMETTHLSPDGKQIEVDFSLKPLRDAGGRITHLIPEGRDVTSQRRAERELRAVAEANARHDELFRMLVEGVKEYAIFLLDQNGCVKTWNAGAERLKGYKSSEIIGRHFSTFYPGEDVADGKPTREIAIATETGQYIEEGWRVRKDGSRFFANVAITALRDDDGKLKGFAKVTRDLTERRRLEDQNLAALKEASDLKAALDEHAIVAMTDRTGKITYVNDKFCAISKYSRSELIGWDHRIINSGHHSKEFFKTLWQTISKGKVWKGELCNRAKDGSLYWVDTTIVPFLDAHGKPVQYVAIRADITELRRSQTELQLAKEAAEAASRAKGNFLANMSHEIRTPMTSIIGYTDLLSTADRSPAERREFVETIRRNGEHLLILINDLLDLSKIEAGKMTVERIAMSPAKALSEVQSPMLVQATGKNIGFVIEKVGELPDKIYNDPTRIRQVLLNLVSNAVKFTKTGEVKITVSCSPDNGLMTFRVKDTGIGLTPDQQKLLFQPFAQADTSTTRQFGGTGLGLALCKRLVEMLGGTITVKSEIGCGSTFSFSVRNYPEIERTGPDESEPVFGARPARLKARVLLAEDAADNRRLVSLYLEEAGMTVEHAVNGRLAVDRVIAAAAKGEPFDLVLMDMQMPELDGCAATREIRASGLTTVPIIAFTAHAMESERQRCTSAGCDGFVTKPVNPDELIHTICKHVLGQKEEDQPATTMTAQKSCDDPGDVSSLNLTAVRSATDSRSEPQLTLRSTMLNYPGLAKLIGEYIAGLPAVVTNIKELADMQDLESLRRLAHQIRGAGGGYGFNPISEAAAKLEAGITEQGSIELIQTQIAELLDILQNVEGYAQAEIPMTQPS